MFSNSDQSIQYNRVILQVSRIDEAQDKIIQGFTVAQLETLLEACSYSLLSGQSIEKCLENDGCDCMFDAALLIDFNRLYSTRIQVLDLITIIVAQLREAERK